MDYEKLYKEALERAKAMIEVADKQEEVYGAAITIFPELKESEDERIRKSIIATIHLYYGEPLEEEAKEMLAWLEKQGEQKFVDMVEPKFKAGDWVVYKNDICQIVKREEGCNKLVTNFGIEKELVNERNLSTARLWTIQDAKDGDVLAAHECYVLFKEIDGLNIKCHCTYHYMGFNPSFHIDTLQNKDAFRPANKEQRELLFSKMHEAGYDWDSEKKELKTIEQQMASISQAVNNMIGSHGSYDSELVSLYNDLKKL